MALVMQTCSEIVTKNLVNRPILVRDQIETQAEFYKDKTLEIPGSRRNHPYGWSHSSQTNRKGEKNRNNGAPVGEIEVAQILKHGGCVAMADKRRFGGEKDGAVGSSFARIAKRPLFLSISYLNTAV